MNQPLVYVLVINWNGLEHIEECFSTLLASTYENTRFLLIDNASADASVAFVRKRFGADARVEVLELPENLGWGGGNYAGMEYALERGADYIFLLNNDTATAPEAIAALVKAAESSPRVGAWAPKMLLYSHPDLINSLGIELSIIGAGWDRAIGRLDDPRWDQSDEVAGVCGGACFMRADALRKIGLLAPEFSIYLDDLDLGLRMWMGGFEVRTCPAAIVYHKFSATMSQSSQHRRKYFVSTRNRYWLMLRNYPLSQAPFVALACAVAELRAIGRAVLDGAYWRIPEHAKAWMAAIAYLPQAVRFRRSAPRPEGPRAFWRFVHKDRMYFPGVDLPEQGWYPVRMHEGKALRPMSARATLRVKGGRLRVIHVNCYPALGQTDVAVLAGGEVLAELQTLDRGEVALTVAEGELEFVARRIFYAEETGERVDLGGWLEIEPCN